MFSLQNLNFPMDIRSPNDILPALNNDRQLKDVIENISKCYETNNVSDAMSNWANPRSFSQWYAESICNYQSLIKNSWLVSASFTESSLRALCYHKLALRFLKEKNDAGTALEMIVKTGLAAEKMASRSQQLIDQFQLISKKEENAFIMNCKTGVTAEMMTSNALRETYDSLSFFWKGVKCFYLRLANTVLVSDSIDFNDEFEDAIKKSGLCWLAIAKTNLIASRLIEIEIFNNEMDVLKCNLPNRAEVDQLIATFTSSMLDHLEQENKLLAN